MEAAPLVIAYGNPLRRDDGFAAAAAGELERSLPGLAGELILAHQLTVELCEPISRASRVLFLDAAAGEHPGAVHRRPLAPRESGSGSFSHYVDPRMLLALAASLYGRCPPATLVTVTGADFDCGEGLSAPVQAALPAVVREIGLWLAPENPGRH